MAKKNKGTPYTVRMTYGDTPEQVIKVFVPDDFDRVRGTHDTARDLAAAQAFGDGRTWRPAPEGMTPKGEIRRMGTIAHPNGDEMPTVVRMVVTCDRVSSSGCPIEAGEKVYDHATFRIVIVNDREYNSRDHGASHSLRSALVKMGSFLCQGHLRVVRVPAGEPWDYDGTIVASLRVGEGVE